MEYTYQLYGDSQIYSSRLKAHKVLCESLGKNENDFLPIAERLHHRCRDWVEIVYINGHSIVKRPLL